MIMLGFAGLGYAGRRKTRTVPESSADERRLAAPKASFVD